MLKGTKLLNLCMIVAAFLFVWNAGNVNASTLVPQTVLSGECIPQFKSALPIFGPGYNAALPRVNALSHPFLTVTMKEIDQQVLPAGTDTCGLGLTFGKTRVWAYETTDTLTKKVLGPALWPGVTLETKRFISTTVKYVNQLPTFNPLSPTGPGLVQGLISVDQTIHWADPLNSPMMNPCTEDPTGDCLQPFIGAPPAVVHLHGGEVSSSSDGGPEAWFTPDGKTGPGSRTLGSPGPGKAIYFYPNSQEPGTLFFHDHALGATRTNLYSGLAAFYFIRDPAREPRNLPSGPYEIELAIQDRQFSRDSQLFFPDGSGDPNSNLNGTPANPTIHPFWIPEFFGDVAVVNGAPWPFMKVEPRRYLFRIVDGSNARFYNLTFGNAPVYQIGGDDNYLDAPVLVNTVFIAPGERAYVIVDFTSLAGHDLPPIIVPHSELYLATHKKVM